MWRGLLSRALALQGIVRNVERRPPRPGAVLEELSRAHPENAPVDESYQMALQFGLAWRFR
eukprot:6215254-Pyramimonas_sp.AAC.1